VATEEPVEPIRHEERVDRRERRGNPRRPFTAVFSVRFAEASFLGAGRDLSEDGAYLVTSDELKVDVTFELDGHETRVPARLVRVDPVAHGSLGIALRFDRNVDLG